MITPSQQCGSRSQGTKKQMEAAVSSAGLFPLTLAHLSVSKTPGGLARLWRLGTSLVSGEGLGVFAVSFETVGFPSPPFLCNGSSPKLAIAAAGSRFRTFATYAQAASGHCCSGGPLLSRPLVLSTSAGLRTPRFQKKPKGKKPPQNDCTLRRLGVPISCPLPFATSHHPLQAPSEAAKAASKANTSKRRLPGQALTHRCRRCRRVPV